MSTNLKGTHLALLRLEVATFESHGPRGLVVRSELVLVPLAPGALPIVCIVGVVDSPDRVRRAGNLLRIGRVPAAAVVVRTVAFATVSTTTNLAIARRRRMVVFATLSTTTN